MEKEKIKLMLELARKGDKSAQSDLLDAFMWMAQDKVLVEMNDEDKNWIKDWANSGNVGAICCLNKGFTMRLRTWKEVFVDEETGEEFIVDRYDYINDETTFPVENEDFENLTQIVRKLENLSGDDIYDLHRFNCLDSHMLVEELFAKYKYSGLASILAYNYYNGYESQGVFRSQAKAKYYFELAGEEYEEPEEDDDPIGAKYYISGEGTDAIEQLVNRLADKVGMAYNEFGLYIPVGAFIKTLVGSDEYRGNIIKMEKDDNGIVVSTEVNWATPIEYAIKKAFPQINVRTVTYELF